MADNVKNIWQARKELDNQWGIMRRNRIKLSNIIDNGFQTDRDIILGKLVCALVLQELIIKDWEIAELENDG